MRASTGQRGLTTMLDEIAEALLAIAPVAGLDRIVCAAPDMATALGYDVVAALEDPDDC